jgi:hypothetical protein
MKIARVVLIAILFTVMRSGAWAAESLDTVVVRDAASLTRCYELPPYEQVVRGDKGETRHFIDERAIAKGCRAKAISFLEHERISPAEGLKLARLVERRDIRENALAVYGALIKTSHALELCEDPQLYSTLILGLGHPRNEPSEADSFYAQGASLMNTCLANKAFLADLKEEVGTKKPYASANVCFFLKERKLIGSCEPVTP